MPVFTKYRRQKREPCFFEWLLDVLNRERSPNNAYWIDRDAQIFAVRWVHAKSHLWTPECCELFNLWKIEGSRTWAKDRSKDAEKRMKTNFRMNLRSPNFEELTKEKNHEEYPVRVFQMNKTTAKVGKPLRSVKIDTSKPDKQQNHLSLMDAPGYKSFMAQIRDMPQFYGESSAYKTSTPELHPWSNNPTGKMARMEESPHNYQHNSNASDYLKLYESIVQDSTNNSECSLKLLPRVEDTLNYFPDENSIADYILDIENLSYPSCIPQLSTHKENITNYNPANLSLYLEDNNDKRAKNILQGSTFQNSEVLRHSLVTSPADSGFMERLSFSSVWSGEDLQRTGEDTLPQCCDDIDFMWSLEDISDSVFQ